MIFQSWCLVSPGFILVVLLLPGIQSASSSRTIHWGFSFCRKAHGYCYSYSLMRNQDPTPRLHYCFWTAPPLFMISSHLWLAAVRICLLELGEGQRSWMKPIFHEQETRDIHRICTRRDPTGSCSISTLRKGLRKAVCVLMFEDLPWTRTLA